MSKYHRLTFEERIKIETLLDQRKTKAEIAEYLSRSKSTITNELRTYSGVHYRAVLAHECAHIVTGKRHSGNKIKDYPLLEYYVILRIRQGWSPEQISHRLMEKQGLNKRMQVSHESIYTYIYLKAKGELRKELISHLRQAKGKRKRPAPRADRRTTIPDRVGIEHRPEEVEDRIIPGHWESDLIVGKNNKSAIGTIVERTTRFVIMVKLPSKGAADVRRAFAQELKALPEHMRKTMTHDNGVEMCQHRLFSKETQMQVYFANPYSPWERGTNENTNMLIRGFFPKGTDFDTIPSGKIKHVQDLLNSRPRKTLEWRTPNEVFNAMVLQGKAGVAYPRDVI